METKIRWEYLVIALPDEVFDKAVRHTVELKKLAALGWELVTVASSLAYLKRAAAVEITPQYFDASQLEAAVRRIIGEEFGLNKK